MTTRLVGETTCSLDADEDGYRTYKIDYKIASSDSTDGPANAATTPGLPEEGSTWELNNDVDAWVWCRPNYSVKPFDQQKESKIQYWIVTKYFSNKPLKRCQQDKVEDPLLMPPKLSGSFVRYTEEATVDRFGLPILNSAFEQFRGPQVEFDKNRPQIKIEMNVATFLQAVTLPQSMVDTVNGLPLWGLPTRCIKLSEAPWERIFTGTCEVYFKIHLTFDIRAETFDKMLLDEGTKVLHGHWNRATGAWTLDNINGVNPDPNNPQHFDRFKDRQGENTRVILNGAGLPAGVVADFPPADADNHWFVAINNALNKPVTDTNFWVPQTGGSVTWNRNTTYQFGDVVWFDVNGVEEQFISIFENQEGFNNINLFPDISPHAWFFLPDGLTNKGVWNSTTFYAPGDRVKPASSVADTLPGAIPVQKYFESNFLLLGIPVSF